MVWYILLIALLNLGIGFGVALFFSATRSSKAVEDPALAPPESIPDTSPVDTAAAMVTLQAHLADRKNITDPRTDLSSAAAEKPEAEPLAVNGPEAQGG